MKITSSFIVALALLASATFAKAEQFCAPRDAALSQLEERFEEKALGRGLAVNGSRMIELFVSEMGSWTILVSDPNGHSCIMASGEDWQGLKTLVGDPV